MNAEREKVLNEVISWAGSKRDSYVRGPDLVMRGRDLEYWRDGYQWAMNEVAQHFNMERFK